MDELFLKRMQDMLEDEYPAYLNEIEKSPRRGLRVNTLKINDSKFKDLFDFDLEKSPFAWNGYYIPSDLNLGNTAPYFAGLFYMQEPSASSAVTVLDVQKNMKVLDMCAAPGSKTTQLAEKLSGTGFLVANEINSKRASILLENIERCGTPNTLVLNTDTGSLAKTFPDYFDMVLCDAPCSGEGMMRKNKEAESQWSLNLVEHCASLQKEILENAYACLKPGGTLVYSTCTFAKEENEYMIRDFIDKHPDMHVADANVTFGRHAFNEGNGTEKAIRIFPMDGGEGHFICRLIKDGTSVNNELKLLKSDVLPKFVKQFLEEVLEQQYPYYYVHANRVYGGVFPFIQPGKCKMMRHQVYLGEIKNNRFEPSHHLFTSSFTAIHNVVQLSDTDMNKYLHGETINISYPKGWYAVQWHQHTVGGAYSDGRILKNKFPKAFRLR